MIVDETRSLPQSGAPAWCFTRVGSGLVCNHKIRLERLARDKHSSLLRKYINYGHKKFYNIGPCLISADREFFIEIRSVANLTIKNLEIENKNTNHMDFIFDTMRSTSKKSTCQKVNSLKTPTIAFWLFYAQVDFLASWLFGQLTFWRLAISPSIEYTHPESYLTFGGLHPLSHPLDLITALIKKGVFVSLKLIKQLFSRKKSQLLNKNVFKLKIYDGQWWGLEGEREGAIHQM
jgi:hypothetical protein